jgi:hypothetical protein
VISIPRRYERAFRERYRDLNNAFHLATSHDRSEARFVAAQWVAWLEARDALTKAMDRPDFDTLNTTERKEARALRRQCLVLARTYQMAITKLTLALRRAERRIPQSGEQLAASMAERR